MFKAIFLVPVIDNDGNPFGRELWAELQSRLLDLGGGLSVRTDVLGAWRSPEGRVYNDRSNEYTVALGSVRDIARFVAVVDWARIQFAQEAMYVELAGIPEILGPAP